MPQIVPIAIIIAGLYWLLTDEPEPKEEKKSEKNDHHSSIGGSGGEPDSDVEAVHGNRGVNLDKIQEIISKEFKEVKDVFQTQFDAFRGQSGDHHGGEQNPVERDGKAESVDPEPGKEKPNGKKKKTDSAPE